MTTTDAVARTAAMLGDPTRASMLIALMDGRAHTASELGQAAGVMAQTASGHLAQLVDAGLVVCLQQGRHRYHRLASRSIAHMVESVMAVSGSPQGKALCPPRIIRVGPSEAALRTLRTCYDHLADRVAVAITDVLAMRGQIDLSLDGGAVTDEGLVSLRSLGLILDTPLPGRRGRVFCRPCLDRSERRFHMGGYLGAAFCTHCLEQGWTRPIQGTRALAVTPDGRRCLRAVFGPEVDAALAASGPDFREPSTSAAVPSSEASSLSQDGMPRIIRHPRNETGRDMAVGDIHGHFSRLQKVLDRVGFDSTRDRLFSVGDLVDRGPESDDVLFWLRKPWFHAVCGNHDDYAVRLTKGNPVDQNNYRQNGGSWFLDLPPMRQQEIGIALAGLPVAMEVETVDGAIGIVHADCPLPDWHSLREILENPPTRRILVETEDGCMWSRARIGDQDLSGVQGIRAVVVGHTPLHQPVALGNVYHIDTAGWLPQGYFTLLDLASLSVASEPRDLLALEDAGG